MTFLETKHWGQFRPNFPIKSNYLNRPNFLIGPNFFGSLFVAIRTEKLKTVYFV